MAVTRQTRLSNDDPLHSLQLRLKTLENEHEGMQQECQRLYAYHGKRCAASLQDSVKSLFEVIVFVRKADKKLVDWHYRSNGLKTALRLVGVDRRTHTVIERKTQELQNKVQVVEKKFDHTGVVFDGGLRDTKRMRSGLLQFSTSNVEQVSREVLSTRDEYSQDYEQCNILVMQQSAEHEIEQSKADKVTSSLNETTQSLENAKAWGRAWSVGFCASVGAAAVSAFVFAPSILVTGPLLLASAGSLCAAGSYINQEDELRVQKESIASVLSKRNESLEAMKAQLAESSQNLDTCSEAIAKIDEFQSKNETFRAESQRSLNELYVVQIVLDKVREKLRVISKELHECRYEETRRGIAVRLREVLGAIQDVPKKIKSANAIDIDKATRELVEIDEKTEDVLQIARWSAQAQSS